MCLNRTSVWKVMTIWICRHLLLFNFECLNILCPWIGHLSEKLWPFEFLESFRFLFSSISIYYFPESDIRVKLYNHLNFSRDSVIQFLVSRYTMRLNWTSESKVMTIWTSRELSLFNFKRRDIFYAWIRPQCEKLWPFEFPESFHFSFSSVSICDAPESDIRVKSFDHLNFSRAFIVQFRASRYVLRPNRRSVWKVMTIWSSQKLPLFNFERLNILCAWIGYPSEKLWPY